MLVKVARLGTAVEEIALTDGSNVNDALNAAGLEVENEEIRVNSVTADQNKVLRDSDIVTLVPKVKGGQRIVKVARLGTAVQEVAVSEEATVQDVLDAAGISTENEEVRIDGHSADLDDEIGSGTLVTLVPKVKGGK